jgi:tetratricopeptide (TPR) repeat protein
MEAGNMSADRATPDAVGANGAEDEVWGAIGAFEQILEAMPDDTASLAALSHAYAQVGDHAKAVDYLLRLGNALLTQSDFAAAEQLVDKLKPYEDDPNVQELMQRITQLSSFEEPAETPVRAAAPSVSSSKISPHEVAALSSFKVADELSLAWSIMESGELTQDEYANVVQDLSEMSASDSTDTISVLHVLEARGYKNLEKILENLAKECGTPFVSLTSYEFQWQAVSLLPEQFCSKRGTLAFELLGDDVLVAVMNPQDQQLRKDVRKILGRKCHFYLALSSEFDQVLARYSEALENDGEQE